METTLEKMHNRQSTGKEAERDYAATDRVKQVDWE